MKIYLMACKNCDYKMTHHILDKENKKGYLLKCLKCGNVNLKYHTKTFLMNREIDTTKLQENKQ